MKRGWMLVVIVLLIFIVSFPLFQGKYRIIPVFCENDLATESRVVPEVAEVSTDAKGSMHPLYQSPRENIEKTSIAAFDTNTILEIRSHIGTPVLGAAAFLSQRNSRMKIDSDVNLRVGTSDGSGEIAIPAGIESKYTKLIVTAAEYASKVLPLRSLLGKRTVIVLDDVFRHRIECVDNNDRPLKGVAVGLSRSDFSSAELDLWRKLKYPAGLDPFSAFYGGESDDQGMIYFNGLSAGKYVVSVSKAGFAMANPQTVVAIPQENHKIVLVAAQAIVARPDNDRVLSWSMRPINQPIVLTSQAEVARKLTNELQQRFPEALVIVGFSVEALPVTLDLLLENAGAALAELHFRSIFDKDLEQPLIITQTPGLRENLRECRFRVIDASNSSIDVDDLVVSFKVDAQMGFSLPVKTGASIQLPVGKHSIRLMGDELVSGRYSKEFTVENRKNQVIEVRLDTQVRKCRIIVQDDDYHSFNRGFLTFSTDGVKTTSFIPSFGERLFLLPVGQANIGARVYGFQYNTNLFRIEPADPNTVQDIHISLQR